MTGIHARQEKNGLLVAVLLYALAERGRYALKDGHAKVIRPSITPVHALAEPA